jgi:hypothetical protein
MTVRERLRTWLETHGHRQAELVGLTHSNAARICRFLAGSSALPLAAYRAIEAFTEGAVKADELAAEAPSTAGARRTNKQSKVTRLRVADPQAAGAETSVASEAPPIPGFPQDLPTRLAEAAGHPEAEFLFAGMLTLATSASSGAATRQRAFADLIDRLVGKAVQRVLDTTPKPPEENAELMLVLRQLEEAPDAPTSQESTKAEPGGAPNA